MSELQGLNMRERQYMKSVPQKTMEFLSQFPMMDKVERTDKFGDTELVQSGFNYQLRDKLAY